MSVQVASSSATLAASIKAMVDNHNKFRDQLATLTAFDTTQNQASTLTGDATALRLDMDLTGLLSGKFAGAGRFQSLAEVGIKFTQEGKLQFDQDKFDAAWADDPAAVEQFLSAKNTGVAARLGDLIEQLAGEDNSLTSRRLEALDSKVADNEKKIQRLTLLLDSERLRLLTSFYNMETAVANIQNNLKALDSITWITEQYSSTKSS